MPASGQWVSTKQVRALPGISRPLLYRMMDTGELAAFMIGRVEPGSLGHLIDGEARDREAGDRRRYL